MPPTAEPAHEALHRVVVRPTRARSRPGAATRRRSRSMADYADDAAALLAALGWDRAGVVGTSFGGMVALNLAVRHPRTRRSPGAVLHLTGWHPSVVPVARTPVRARRARRSPCGCGSWTALGSRRRRTDPRPRARSTTRWPREARGPLDPEAAIGLRRQLLARAGHDVVDALGSIVAPTLVCAGRHDDLAPLENSEFLADPDPRRPARGVRRRPHLHDPGPHRLPDDHRIPRRHPPDPSSAPNHVCVAISARPVTPKSRRKRGLCGIVTQPTRRSWPAQNGSRRSFFSTLPLGLRGRTSSHSTVVGHLNVARRSLA